MAGMFDLPTAGNIFGDALGAAAQSAFPSYTPGKTNWTPQNLFDTGSPLGTKYTPSMFGSAYSNFNFGQTGGYGSPSSSPYISPLSAGQPGIATGQSGSSGGGSRGGGGGGSRQSSYSVAAPQATPIEFSLGPAPTLKELNLNYEEMGKRAMEANTPFRQQYKSLVPGAEAGLLKMSELANQQLSGQLSRDMASQIGRGAASLGFSTGLGGRSGIGRNILAQDLGLEVLKVQQQGADTLARSSALAQQAMQAMSPIAPGQVFSEAANQSSINQGIGNQNLLAAWQSQNIPGTFDVSKGQFAGYQPGTFSTTRPVSPDIIAAAEAAKKAGGGKYSPYYQGYRV